MERKGIQLGDMPGQHRVPGNLLSVRNQVQAGGCQGGHVQRLANVASRLRPIRMVVEKRAARGKVEQRHATQNCQRAPRTPVPEDRYPRVHTLTPLSVAA
jgi:hypothetical protein